MQGAIRGCKSLGRSDENEVCEFEDGEPVIDIEMRRAQLDYAPTAADLIIKVQFAEMLQPCPICEELKCSICDEHWWECDHPGPHQEEDFEYIDREDGTLWAIPRT